MTSKIKKYIVGVLCNFVRSHQKKLCFWWLDRALFILLYLRVLIFNHKVSRRRIFHVLITLRSLYCKKMARNFSLIILSHNLGTSLRQNHKKNVGVTGINPKIWFFWSLTWGLMGISTSWLFKKKRLEIFWWKFQGLLL